MDKHGWIRIVEAFIAILLLFGIFLFVLKNQDTKTPAITSSIYNAQKFILKTIQLNTTLRTEILGTGAGVREWDNFPTLTYNAIRSRTPTYLDCIAKICPPSDLCILTEQNLTSLGIKESEIYAESIIITSNQTYYNPRVLRLFCWDKL